MFAIIHKREVIEKRFSDFTTEGWKHLQSFFQGHADFKLSLSGVFFAKLDSTSSPPDRTDAVFTMISELHFQVSGIKRRAAVGSASGFSYWINRSGGTPTFALRVDRSFSWFVSPAGSPEGPRLVKHSWVHAGIKAKVSFDGTSHFSVQQSALWELEGKWIVARVAHPAWVETTALSFITRASAGSVELSTSTWINCTEITLFCLCFLSVKRTLINSAHRLHTEEPLSVGRLRPGDKYRH